MMDAIQRAVPVPQAEVIMHGASGRQILGQRAPLAAGAQNVHHAVDHLRGDRRVSRSRRDRCCLAYVGRALRPGDRRSRWRRRFGRFDLRLLVRVKATRQRRAWHRHVQTRNLSGSRFGISTD